MAQQAAALDLRLKRTSIEVKTGEARKVVDNLVESFQELDVDDDNVHSGYESDNIQSDTSFEADQQVNGEFIPQASEEKNVKVDRKESVSSAPYLAPVQALPECLYEAIYDFDGTTVTPKPESSN